MQTYIVTVSHVYTTSYTVEADTAERAEMCVQQKRSGHQVNWGKVVDVGFPEFLGDLETYDVEAQW